MATDNNQKLSSVSIHILGVYMQEVCKEKLELLINTSDKSTLKLLRHLFRCNIVIVNTAREEKKNLKMETYE